MALVFPKATITRVHLDHVVTPVVLARITLFLASFIQGSSTIASDIAMKDIPPIALALGRFGIASLILLAICAKIGIRPNFGMGSVILGIAGVTIAFAAQNIGLQFTEVTESTLIIKRSTPIFTVVLGFWLLKERITRWQSIALVLAVTGVATAMIPGSGQAMDFSLVGGLITLVAAIGMGAYAVIGRHLFQHGISTPVVTGSIAIGTLLLTPIALVELLVSDHVVITGTGVSLLLYLGVCGSALVHLLWAFVLNHLAATEVAVLGTLMPVVSVIFVTLFLGGRVTSLQSAGGLLIGFGLYLFIRRSHTVEKGTRPGLSSS
jgi:drug/metabolite transporter (DMT)-like permease